MVCRLCALSAEVEASCGLMQDLAAAIMEVDVDKFTDIVKEFDSMSRLVSPILHHEFCVLWLQSSEVI